MDVLLVEQRKGVPDKACGEGIMPTGLAALYGVGVDPEGRAFRGIRYLDATGRRQVRAELDAPARGVRRTTLVAALQQRGTECGVERHGERVTEVVCDATPAVTFDDGRVERAGVVFACDGLGSTVRRSIGVERPTSAAVRYGLRGHFGCRPWTDDVEVHWAHASEAYVTPVADDLVGVAILGERGGSFEQRLAAFPALRARLGDAHRVGSVLGAGPLRRRVTRPVRGSVLLVGDAAGYVDALTGEGLSVGFAGAQAAVQAVLDGVPERYADDWASVTRRFRWGTDLLLRSTQQSSLRRALLPAASAMPGVFGRAVARLT